MSEQKKSWQARIAEATDALAQDFVESVSYDWRLYRQDIAGSITHATMLAKVGLITEADREAIVSGLKEIESEIDSHGREWPGFKKELEDIHMCVEAALIERIGEPGRRLHTGRSRNDQVATDLLLWCKHAADQLSQLLEDVGKSLVQSAERHVDYVMPCYTHLQRAQPISVGAEVLAWATLLDQAKQRLGFLVRSGSGLNDRFALGSGAIAGSTLPLNRKRTQHHLLYGQPLTDEEANESTHEQMRRVAKQFGSAGMAEAGELMESMSQSYDYPAHEELLGTASSIGDTASRDAALDFVYACCMTAMHLSRWAEQWIIYSSQEFGFIRTADRYTTGSSMMPQKRNPDMLELIRGRCGNVYGSLVALLTICKGLPIGYNRDLQEDKRHVFAAYDTVSGCLTMAAAIVNATDFVKEKCEAACEGGFMDATSLAEYLVVKGVPFRTAHQVVGGLVARCEREGKTKLSELKVEDFVGALAGSGFEISNLKSPIIDDVYACLGARNVVARYQSAGAAGGEPLKKQLAEWKQRLGL